MASVYDLKPKFQGLLRPRLRGLRALGFTPNGLTLLALAGSLTAGAAVWFARERPRLLWLLPGWLFVRMALNALDGMMAREMDLQSRLGAVLNEAGDLLSDAALYLPLARFAPGAAPAIVAFAFLAALTEFCGLLAQTLGCGRAYQGPMGKSDRAFLVGLAALLAGWHPGWTKFAPALFGALALLALVTCVNRLRPALRPPAADAKGAA